MNRPGHLSYTNHNIIKYEVPFSKYVPFSSSNSSLIFRQKKIKIKTDKMAKSIDPDHTDSI